MKIKWIIWVWIALVMVMGVYYFSNPTRKVNHERAKAKWVVIIDEIKNK